MNKSDNLAISAEIFQAALRAYVTRGVWRLEGERAHPAHRFFWITRGQGRISICGRMRGISPNTVLFVPAGLVHSLEIGNTTLGYMASIPDNLPVPVPANPARIRAASVFEQGQLTGFFEHIAAEINGREVGYDHAIESYLTLLSLWLERRQDKNDWPGSHPDTAPARLLARFKQGLERRQSPAPTVATCASALRVSPSHLSRVCREILDKPAATLIHERLILEAKYRLADSPQPIGEIAADLGFGSATYFSRLFHRETGISPRKFRQRAANR